MENLESLLTNLSVEECPDLTILSEEDEHHSGNLTWVIPENDFTGKRFLTSKCFSFGTPDYCKCTFQLNYEEKLLNNRSFTLFESIVIKFAQKLPKSALVEGTASFVKQDGENYDASSFVIEDELDEAKLEAFRKTDHINKYFWDGQLVIRCCMRMKLGSSQWEAGDRKLSMPKNVDFETEKYQASLFKHKNFADVKFRIRGGITEAHKSILARDVESFRILFNSASQQEGLFKFYDIDKPTLDVMLGFIYSKEMPILNFPLACKLIVAAHSYEVFDLKYICSSYLGASLTEMNVFVVLSIAHKAEDLKLKEFCIQFINKCNPETLALNSVHVTK